MLTGNRVREVGRCDWDYSPSASRERGRCDWDYSERRREMFRAYTCVSVHLVIAAQVLQSWLWIRRCRNWSLACFCLMPWRGCLHWLPPPLSCSAHWAGIQAFRACVRPYLDAAGGHSTAASACIQCVYCRDLKSTWPCSAQSCLAGRIRYSAC